MTLFRRQGCSEVQGYFEVIWEGLFASCKQRVSGPPYQIFESHLHLGQWKLHKNNWSFSLTHFQIISVYLISEASSILEQNIFREKVIRTDIPALSRLKLEVISGKAAHHRTHQRNILQYFVLKKDFDIYKYIFHSKNKLSKPYFLHVLISLLPNWCLTQGILVSVKASVN